VSNSPTDGPPPPAPVATAAEQDASTVGTGSVFAIGCTVISLILIAAGIVVYVVLKVFA